MKLTMTARRTAMSGKPRRVVAFLKSIGARGAGAKPGSPLVWFALNLPCNLSLPEGQDCPSWVAGPPPGGPSLLWLVSVVFVSPRASNPDASTPPPFGSCFRHGEGTPSRQAIGKQTGSQRRTWPARLRTPSEGFLTPLGKTRTSHYRQVDGFVTRCPRLCIVFMCGTAHSGEV